jgi:hypothetical protein
MYAGAAITSLTLIATIISVPVTGGGWGSLRLLGRNQPVPVVITAGIIGALILIALWLWMARANARGRNWARILSTVLFGLATLHLLSDQGLAGGVAQVVFAMATWLVGLAVVWLLWRPSSSAFFKLHGFTRAGQDLPPSPG